MNKKLLYYSFRNTALATIYIFVVSQIMQNGDKWFSTGSETLGAFVVLLLFSLSAAVVGGLVFGKSLILFLDNKREYSVKSAIYSVSCLGLYTILGLIALFITK